MAKPRHFLNLADYSAEAVLNLLKRSSEMKRGIPRQRSVSSTGGALHRNDI